MCSPPILAYTGSVLSPGGTCPHSGTGTTRCSWCRAFPLGTGCHREHPSSHSGRCRIQTRCHSRHHSYTCTPLCNQGHSDPEGTASRNGRPSIQGHMCKHQRPGRKMSCANKRTLDCIPTPIDHRGKLGGSDDLVISKEK